MKLLWDAVGTEFGGRHELYERNYAGNHENTRVELLTMQMAVRAARRLQGVRGPVPGRVRPGRLDGPRSVRIGHSSRGAQRRPVSSPSRLPAGRPFNQRSRAFSSFVSSMFLAASRNIGGAVSDVMIATRTMTVYMAVDRTPSCRPTIAMITSMAPRAFRPAPSAIASHRPRRAVRAPR